MMRQIYAIIFLLFATSNLWAQDISELEIKAKKDTVLSQYRSYTTGGFAEIEINRSSWETFEIITAVTTWPEINLGITKKVVLKDPELVAGAVFEETISSPIPGFADWTNEWRIEEYEPGVKFVISGRDNFAKAPIYSRITYTFKDISKNKTLFRRQIEVTLDDSFNQKASREEMEALYRF